MALEGVAGACGQGGLPQAAKRAGSFMSSQKPATPISRNPLSFSPHQARALGSVKSGKAASPGHTGPRTTSPEGRRQKSPSLRPSS